MKKLILALAAVLILTACGRETPAPQTVSLSLEANPTTGYSWQVSQSEELFKVESSYAQRQQSAGLVGAGGTETFTLTPLKAGTTELTLTYARPWENGEKADQLVYSFEIDPNLQVTMTNGYSTAVDEPIPVPTPTIT
jgi:inhibitor of cysteine peptidase